MVFLSYLSSLFGPIREISKFTGRIAKSTAALERIEEIARLNPQDIGAVELPGAVEAPSFRGNIEWKEVTFGYRPDQAVLQNFSWPSRQAGKWLSWVNQEAANPLSFNC